MSEKNLQSTDSLLEELRELQKRQSSATDWNPATEGRRLLTLQEMMKSKSPFPPELGKRQALAGTVVNGKRQPELTAQERATIIAANKNQSRRGR